MIMAREEDARNARRDALLAMHAQTGEAQKPPEVRQPEMRPHMDLSQLRPAVRDDVGAKPEIEREMRRADSQLLRFHQLEQG
jgi:hypothetical protein